MKYIDNYNLLPNIRVEVYYNENNEIRLQLIYPCEGYILRITSLDEYFTDEENKNFLKPYRTQGGATVQSNYNWSDNTRGFSAEAYFEGIEDEIIEIHPENNDTPELTEDIIEKAKAYDILMGASE